MHLSWCHVDGFCITSVLWKLNVLLNCLRACGEIGLLGLLQIKEDLSSQLFLCLKEVIKFDDRSCQCIKIYN